MTPLWIRVQYMEHYSYNSAYPNRERIFGDTGATWGNLHTDFRIGGWDSEHHRSKYWRRPTPQEYEEWIIPACDALIYFFENWNPE